MKTFFISGHRDITPEEFNEHYVPAIDKALSEKNITFVIGDYHGVDHIAQEYLKNKKAHVVVFHMFEYHRENAGHPTLGGFKNDEERDAAMTKTSDEDIAWVRPGKEKSGTAINLRRRNKECSQ